MAMAAFGRNYGKPWEFDKSSSDEEEQRDRDPRPGRTRP